MKLSPLKKIQLGFLACVVFAVSIAVFLRGGFWSTLAFLTLTMMAVLVGITVRTPADTENVFDRHKKGAILLATVAGCVLVIACCFAPFLSRIADMTEARFADADLFEYYTAQLSLTFISISVMSVLSDKSVIIYWANVSEDRLIRPTFSCFAAYTYYSIGATVGAGLGVFLDNAAVFVAFFAANVVVLILLTVSMIDVYYGRDTKKKKLAQTLVPDSAHNAVYKTKMLGLEQNILRAADEKDMAFLQEVYELYISHPEKFQFDIGREAISAMVSTLDAQTTGPFLRALDNNLRERLNSFPSADETFDLKMVPRQCMCKGFDTDLWWALSTDKPARFLEQVSAPADGGISSPNAALFLRTIVRRIALEYNRCVVSYLVYCREEGKEIDPDEYFVSDVAADEFTWSIYQPKTADGTPLPFERYKEVLDQAKWLVFPYDEQLSVSLVHLVGRLVKDGHNWITVQYLTALPFVKYWLQENSPAYDASALAILEKLPEEADC